MCARKDTDKVAPDKVVSDRLYNLRSLMLAVDQAQADLALARIEVAQAQLEIERQYGILGEDAKLDINTGKITRGPDEKQRKEAEEQPVPQKE